LVLLSSLSIDGWKKWNNRKMCKLTIKTTTRKAHTAGDLIKKGKQVDTSLES